jgi:DNA-binding MarR family transcriptional regulator
MPQPEPLSPELRQFVESMGAYFEKYGLPRIGGRMLGLLIIADRPLSLDDLAHTLHVSRASVSTNIRLIVASGFAEAITVPGDRRDYYRYGPDTWELALRTELEGILMLRRLGERGLAAARASDAVARQHLGELLELCDLMYEDRRVGLEHWRAHRQAKLTRSTPAAADTIPDDTTVDVTHGEE